MSLTIQDQSNILQGIRGRLTMRFEIINALFLREVVNHKEGSLNPRGRETLDKIASSELQDNETPT